MKLRLTQAGYENYTGMLGMLTFTNGLSDQDVSIETAAGMANIIQCDKVDASTSNDLGALDVTDPDVVVRNTDGDPDVAVEPAPVDSDNTDIEPV